MIKLSVVKTFILIVCVVLSTGCSTEERSSDRDPNVVILFVDDWGYFDMGFRNDDFYTPNIDRFRKTAVDLKHAYTASPTCSPSRAALYTGLHPAELEIYRHTTGSSGEYNMWEDDPAQLPSRQWLPLEVETYAEMLKRHNYNTVFLGKWHLGGEAYRPAKQGFDQVYSNPSSGHPNSYYPPYFNKGDFEGVEEGEYLTDYLTNKAVRYLENYEKNKPFLMQFSYYNVHRPPVGRTDFLDHYEEVGFTGDRKQYGAQVSAVDASIGRLLASLEENGMADNTIVMLLSDQGSYYNNDPLRGTKATGTALYEGSARIPFLLRWPGVTSPGSTIETHIQNTDIFPTLAEMVGDKTAVTDSMEGTSLVGLLRDGEPLEREALYAYRSYTGQYASVLTDDKWKIIAYRDETYELYKVDEDTAEQQNLADQYPDKVQELATKLKQWKEENGIP